MLFRELLLEQTVEGSRDLSRETNVIAVQVKAIRTALGLSQSGFAKLISVSVDTLKTRSKAGENLLALPKHCLEPSSAIRSTSSRPVSQRLTPLLRQVFNKASF
ncbi:hypothetical protein SPM24T3_15771 [Serratia sp. M24T3]|nr:hypothetical protein SPM24T3_15771 [Serratia sp. M24T3]